jgi:hypothetical protein
MSFRVAEPIQTFTPKGALQMSKQEEESKKTSRRSFGKQLTGAVAAISIASLACKGEEKSEETQTKGPLVQAKKITHDTPPPTEIVDGSLAVESYVDFGNPTAQGNRWQYKQSSSPKIAHIKILHGSGDMIYRNLSADGCTIRLDWKDKDGTTDYLKISGNQTVFMIDCDKRMNPGRTGKKHRPYRWDHPGNSKDFRIESIKVSDSAGNTLFQVTAPPPPSPPDVIPEEYKVMIWHEGD